MPVLLHWKNPLLYSIRMHWSHLLFELSRIFLLILVMIAEVIMGLVFQNSYYKLHFSKQHFIQNNLQCNEALYDERFSDESEYHS